MPIEIKELHIRVSVDAGDTSKPAGAPGPAPGSGGEARQEIVAECVDQVMEILRIQRER